MYWKTTGLDCNEVETTIYFGNYHCNHASIYGRRLHVNKADGQVSNNLEYDKISLLSSLRLAVNIYYIDIVSHYHITLNK